MKKILLVLALILPMVAFMGCSSSDDKGDVELTTAESALVGEWIEDTDDASEVFHLTLRADHTALSWCETNGTLDSDGVYQGSWSATSTTFTQIGLEGTLSYEYSLSNGRLSLGEITYKRK